MKKAKVFLTALAVLAVVGGALAFKAKQAFHYGKCDIKAQVCTLDDFFSQATTDASGANANFDIYNHACVNDACTTKTVFSE